MRRALGPLVGIACLAVACASDSSEATAGDASIRLVTDTLGVTHVYASNDADAMRGGGYAMARDRLFEMEMYRRRARGTVAEVLGKARVADDATARAFDFAALGAADHARLVRESPASAALVTAWVGGVNARIAEVRSGGAPRPYGLGPEGIDLVPEPWTEPDTFAVGKLLAVGLSSTVEYELFATALERLAPAFASAYPLVLPAYDVFTMSDGAAKRAPAPAPAPVRTPPAAATLDVPWRADSWLYDRLGSNNWAVDGAHSTNGRPLLAGDPHQPASSPSRFWPVHISSVAGGGTLDVIGFSFVGTPVIELGHNARVAWTATTNFADVTDLWAVDVDAAKTKVVLGDGEHAVTTRHETLRVRRDGAPFGTNDETTIDVHAVPGYGVLLPDQALPVPRALLTSKPAILIRWTGFEATNELASYLALDRARNLDEVEAAIDLSEVGAANFVAADATGITYHVGARIPDRGAPGTHPMPTRLLDGGDARTLWTGAYLPRERLPHLRNPAKGFLGTANNDPWGFTADGSVDDDPFYYGAFYATGLRAQRIDARLRELLAGGAKLDRATFEAMQGDTYSVMAETVLPHLADAVGAIGTDPKLAAWASRDDLATLAASLAAWPKTFDRERGEPLVMLGLEWFAARRLFEAKMTRALFEAIGSKSPPYVLGALRNTLEGRYASAGAFMPDGPRPVLLAALDDTATWLRARFGTTDPSKFRMRDVHAAVFPAMLPGTALEVPRDAVSGSADTICVSDAPFFSGGEVVDRFDAAAMSIYRMVVAFDDDGTPSATVDFTRGASGEPTSPHFGDRQADWVDVLHRPMPFREADVAAKTESVVVLAR